MHAFNAVTASPEKLAQNINLRSAILCRAFVKEMSSFGSSQFDAAAVSTGRHLPVESAMPGTTLQIIPLEAFESGGTLYGEEVQKRTLSGTALQQSGDC